MNRLARTLWPEERELARPPEQMSVSQWADRYRILDAAHAMPGQWSTDYVPPVRGIMDSYTDPHVEDLILMGSTQWGKSETIINCLLYTIDQDPVPCLLVMPSEEDVISFGNRKLKPAIEASPRVSRHRTGWKADWKATEIAFEGMTLYFGWAQSPSRLASRSIARLFLDEVDKYPFFSGREADPISLATERLRWWDDRKRIVASTPRTPDDYIWPLWQQSDRRRYHVPCPHCGHFQPLVFSLDTVRFSEGERDPQRIRAGRLAWYVCRSCQKAIPDQDDVKRRMLLAGVWCPEEGEVLADGTVRGRLDAACRGFHVNALYSPKLTWSDVAAEFLASKDDVRRLMNFTNSWLGWPWIEKAEENTLQLVASRACTLPRGVVPDEAIVITAGVDVQKRVIYYSVRAWGLGERSVTIEAGAIDRVEQLEAVLIKRTWSTRDGRPMQVRLACIDQGYRTDEVHAFCANFPDICRPVRGVDHLAAPLRAARIERDWLGRPGGLARWDIDTSYYKDKLTRHIHAPRGATGSWEVHAEPSEEYLRHMTAEHKVLVRSRTTKDVREAWVPRPGAGGNHFWDCEVYNQAAGDMLALYALRDEVSAQAVAAATGGLQPERHHGARGDASGGRRGFGRRLGGRGRWIRKRSE